MKKNIYVVMAALMLSTSGFAKCGSISLGFVTIITGTYYQQQFVGYDQNLNPMYETVEVKCSEGNRWQWFWE